MNKSILQAKAEKMVTAIGSLALNKTSEIAGSEPQEWTTDR